MWESPDGKVKPGEDPEGVLHRELCEKLGIEMFIVVGVGVVTGSDDDWALPGERRVRPWAAYTKGEPRLGQGRTALWWSGESDLESAPWLEGDLQTLSSLVRLTHSFGRLWRMAVGAPKAYTASRRTQQANGHNEQAKRTTGGKPAGTTNQHKVTRPLTYPLAMPKISRESLSKHRERTREALFAALSDPMATKGLDTISMGGLANESGIGRTAMCNHSSDKEELLLAYVEFEMNAYMDRISSKLTQTNPPLNRLYIYVYEQMLVKRGYFFSPRAPLRDVVSKETAVALREHAPVTGRLSRRILNECVEVSAIPDQSLDVTVQLLQGALTGRHIPEDESAHSTFFDMTDHFALCSVGAPMPDDPVSLSP